MVHTLLMELPQQCFGEELLPCFHLGRSGMQTGAFRVQQIGKQERLTPFLSTLFLLPEFSSPLATRPMIPHPAPPPLAVPTPVSLPFSALPIFFFLPSTG